jgi:hypothetical protein
MKGPGRHRYATRRTWECPNCRRKEITGGDVTTLQCLCQVRVNPPVINWMKLLEDPHRRPRPVPLPPEPAVVVDVAPPEPSPVLIVPPVELDTPPAG